MNAPSLRGLLVALCGACCTAWATPDPPHLRSTYERPAAQWPAPWIDAGVAFVELGAYRPPPAPATAREQGLARLGERLFFDPRLSVDGRVSCASCHRPDEGWTVRGAKAAGVHGRIGRRNPPTLLEVALRSHWGWDGAGDSLAAQSLRPLTDPDEMGNRSLAAAWRRVVSVPAYAAELRALSEQEGGAPPSPPWLGDALAAFQRTRLHQQPSRFDRFAQGERLALSDLELQGLHLFRTRARCANCHFGPTLSDGKFHNLGIAFFGTRSQDLGRHEVTGRCADAGRFRTPSLRHVSQTAPYMHHGLFDTLTGVVHLYARGGGDPRARDAAQAADPLLRCAAQVSPHLKPLPLSEADLSALRAFLQAL